MYVYSTVYCHLNPAPAPPRKKQKHKFCTEKYHSPRKKNVVLKVAKEVVEPIMTLLLRTDGDDRSPPEG